MRTIFRFIFAVLMLPRQILKTIKVVRHVVQSMTNNACSLAFSVDGRELYAGGLGRLFQIPFDAGDQEGAEAPLAHR